MSRVVPPYVDVALDIPGAEPFTYSLPRELASRAALGKRVEVPVARRRMIGVIVSFKEHTHLLCKPIASILDEEPVLDEHLLWLTHWVGQRYLCSWGQVIWAALPPGLHRKQQLVLRLKNQALEQMELAQDEARVVNAIKERGCLSLDWLRQRYGDDIVRVVESLQRKRVLFQEAVWRGGRAQQRRERWLVRLGPEPSGKMSPARAELWSLLCAKGALPAYEVASRSAADWLVRGGWAAWEMRECSELPTSELSVADSEVKELTDAQWSALKGLEKNIVPPRFQASLIFGVTASGKTEIYIRAARLAAAHGRQILILVPEIGLVGQMAARFKRHFSALGLWHSEMAPGQRYDVWSAARGGRLEVVVGVRSAVFAPLPNLGLIIIDEEQDASYKQQDGDPLYHARTVALARARRLNIPLILGSATPSLESYWQTQSGAYELYYLPQRVSPSPMPVVEIVDHRSASRNEPIISPILEKAIAQEIGQGRQAMLLLNRRGYARFIQCRLCGAVLRCRNCDISLTYHRIQEVMLCHYCGYRQRLWIKCPQCGSPNLGVGSQGIQRLEEELKKFFPDLSLVRMDSDTTERRGSHEEILRAFQEGRAKILIGTQMIAKGHHFPAVGLVGMLNIDEMMALPDFRSAEKVAQLIFQMSGRTGRGSYPGRVVIQTKQPGAAVFAAAQHQDYRRVLEDELKQRKEAGYPPFNNIVLITVAAADEQRAKSTAEGLADVISRRTPDITVLGPAPAAIPKMRGRYRYQILLKHGEVERLLTVCRGLGQRKGPAYIHIDAEPVATL